MPTGLKDRPDSLTGGYDPDSNDARSPMTKKPSTDGSHDDLGEMSPAQQAKSDQMDAELRNMTNAETPGGVSTSAGNSSATNSAEDGLSSANGSVAKKLGKGYVDFAPQTKFAKLVTKLTASSGKGRQRSGITLALGSTGAMLVMMFMTFAPTSFTEYMRNLGLNKAGEIQTNQAIKYRRSRLAKASDFFSVEGRRGGKIIAEMTAKGYDFSFDPTDRNKITAINLPNGQTVTGVNIGDQLEGYLETKHKFRSAQWRGNRMKAFSNRYKVPTRSPTDARASKLADPELELNKRLAEGVYGNKADPDIRVVAEVDDSVDEADADARATGATELAEPGGDFEPHKTAALENGTPVNQVGTNVDTIVTDIENPVNPKTFSDIDEIARTGATPVVSAVGSLANATEVPEKVCTIKSRLRMAVMGARVARAIGLQSLAALTVILPADAIRVAQGKDSQMINEITNRFFKQDGSGYNVGSAVLTGYLTTGVYNRNVNAIQGTGYNVSGGLFGVFKSTQQITDSFPGTSQQQCNVWRHPGTAVGAIGVQIVAFAFSGGTSQAAITTARKGVEFSFKTAVKKIINRSVVRSLGRTAAIELSFAGILAMTQLYTEKVLSFPITGQEVGGDLTNKSLTGMLTNHKQRNLMRGYAPLTANQYIQIENQFYAEKKERLKGQSFASRIFDTNNTDSLAFRHYLQVPRTTESISNTTTNLAQALPTSVFKTPSSVANTVASIFTPAAYAQENQDDEIGSFDVYETEGDNSGIELAVDPGGNVITGMLDYGFDAYENEQYLKDNGHVSNTGEPIGGDFNDYLENCVYPVDTITRIEVDEADCMVEDELTQRFVTHLRLVDFRDTLDAQLFPEELDGVGSGTGEASTSLGLDGLNGYAIPCEGSPVEKIREAFDGTDWSALPTSGSIGTNSAGQDINVYIREACTGETDVKTVIIGSSIHGSENGGQFISHDLLFNEDLPDNVRIIAIPEINKASVPFSKRKNATGTNESNRAVTSIGIDLNRNFDARWETLTATKNTSPSGKNYKGEAPESAPEAKAVADFLRAIGRVDLFISYHDNIDWVAPVGSTPLAYGQSYSQVSGMSIGNSGGTHVTQRGSMDAWFNEETGSPTLLVELTNERSDAYIQRHVDSVKYVIQQQVLTQ